MLIGISGKIGSGKDTVGEIIKYLIYCKESEKHLGFNYPVETWWEELETKSISPEFPLITKSRWVTKKFADTLKDYVCMAIGCTREQLEDREFKDKELGEEWTQYSYADGFSHNYLYKNGEEIKTTIMNAVPCDKEKYEEERRINWQTAYKQVMTPRLMLQLMGTEAMRNQVHPNFWVNALMSSYKSSIPFNEEIKKEFFYHKGYDNISELKLKDKETYLKLKKEMFSIHHKGLPNWIITDMRFPNELKAVLDKGGISIRVERLSDIKTWLDCNNCQGGGCTVCNGFGKIHNPESAQHESEIALDNAKFKYVISNDGSIEDLVEKVRDILTLEKII